LSAAIHWFRRDLRLGDNVALKAAARDFDVVIPVFVLDDHYRDDPSVGPSRFVFLRESLEDLDRSLRSAGSRLVVRGGPANRALPALLSETGATAVYANEEIGPYPQRRDAEAQRAVETARAKFRLFSDSVAVDPREILTSDGRPYTVFTPFAKKWRAAEKPGPVHPPAAIATPEVPGVPLSRVRAWRDLPRNPRAPSGGETEALRALDAFLARIAFYGSWRDFPGQEGTSRLSAALHFGTVSPRTVLDRARAKWLDSAPEERRSIDEFVSQIAWREFFHAVLFHFPHVASGAFRRELDALEWDGPGAGYLAWTEGRTGFPFIDAAMRQLLAENWMHNRARMAVASFLTKDLHVDWRMGERWFAHNLADADLANNNGGWQWAAGTGVDAAPYFRVFNPVLQGKRFDPSGEYIRRYVPELAHLSDAEIHEPRDPIVDHAAEKAETIRRFERILKRAKI
jgi:deoxyribodipyrimidine photo-lyase